MPQAQKRQRDIYQHFNTILRKPLYRNKKSKNCIESFSNEIFYEIFDYLDGCDIYQAFFNLNIRFQNLLTNSSLLLKIQFSSESESEVEYRYKQFIHPNKQQIISLHFHNEQLINKFFTLCTLDSSFNRLESIILHEIPTFKLVVLLFYFKSLLCLFSLSVSFDHTHDDVGDIYRIVFQLPVLKYFKLNIPDNYVYRLTLPTATKEQQSSIEYLSIYHYLALDDLVDLFSYTPRLTHLYCFFIVQSNVIFQSDVLIPLPNLIHLSLYVTNLVFDQIEEFLVKISSQLRVLSVKFRWTDKSYLDADRWERLILQHIPYLTNFRFIYNDDINNEFHTTPSHQILSRFSSSFWINHQWLFRILINSDSTIYSIHPCSEYLYDFQELRYSGVNSNQNSSLHCYPGVQMCIAKTRKAKQDQIFIDKISFLLEIVDVTRLFIECSQMNYNMFIKILNLLPNLHLLSIKLVSSPEKFLAHRKDDNNLRRFLSNNKITRLSLRNVLDIEEINFIIDLFPRVQYLALKLMRDFDLELIIRYTLRKIRENNMHHPMILCVIAYEAIHDKVQKLYKMIDSEKLLKNYTIDRRSDKFYLQWK